jgi:hypothetical protein
MKVIVAAIVLAARAAAAQPIPRDNCQVTIVRAPEDARAVVEQWVAAEPKCNIKLEIRMVPTDGGLYLLARDEYGRVRERVVPDAQAAGVLVASWVAADSVGPTPYEVHAPVAAPAYRREPVTDEAPGVTLPVAPPVATSHPRWFGLGALVGMSGEGGGGLRGDFDLKNRGRVTFGLGGSLSTSGTLVWVDTYERELATFDAKLMAYVALGGKLGSLRARTSVGAGIVYTDASIESQYMYREAAGVFPAAEASMSIGFDASQNWAVDFGPIVSFYAQEYHFDSTTASGYSYTLMRRDVDLMVFIGLRYRL